MPPWPIAVMLKTMRVTARSYILSPLPRPPKPRFPFETHLARQQEEGQTPLHARFSLSVGDIVIGVIGTPMRRSVALIGPSINLAARLLKQIPPGGIIATESVVEHLHQEAPPLARTLCLVE